MFAPFTASIAQPEISSLIKSISGRGVRRAERGYMNKHFSREILIIGSALKTNPWTYKIKRLNREKNKWNLFMK